MGHLLATVNPEAAAEIGREYAQPPLPPPGTMVRYLARPGEGRGGRMEFPFLVMHHGRDGMTIEGIIFYACDDWVGRDNIRRKSDAQPFACWEPIEQAEAGGMTWRIVPTEPPLDGPSRNAADTGTSGLVRDIQELQYEIQPIINAVDALSARIAALEAKRSPGRPKKVTE